MKLNFTIRNEKNIRLFFNSQYKLLYQNCYKIIIQITIRIFLIYAEIFIQVKRIGSVIWVKWFKCTQVTRFQQEVLAIIKLCIDKFSILWSSIECPCPSTAWGQTRILILLTRQQQLGMSYLNLNQSRHFFTHSYYKNYY